MSKEILTIGEGLLSVGRVAALVDLSVRQIWRLVSAKQFPAPVHVGRAARWRSADVRAFLDGLKGADGNDQHTI